MKILLKHLLVLSTILLSNAYCINTSNITAQISEKNSSCFNTNYLQNIVQNSNNIPYDSVNNEYYVIDKQNLQKIIFSKQQLSNTFNEILTNTYNKIMSINNVNPNDLKLKLQTAEPFYRIIYNPQKLGFILYDNDLNIFNTINNIVNEIKPLCEEYAIANLGQKSILYGIQTLEGTLPTINNQFISGLNSPIDFTRTHSCNKWQFKSYYDKMLRKVQSIQNCINVNLLEKLTMQVILYISAIDYAKIFLNKNNINNSAYINKLINTINDRINIADNLVNFLVKNRESIIKNTRQISANCNNLFREAWNKQMEEVNVYELLNRFFNEITNSYNFQKAKRIDVFLAFFDNLILNKKNLEVILNSNDITLINKLNYFFNRDDIRNVNTKIGLKMEMMSNWDLLRVKKGVGIERKYEIFCEIIIMMLNDRIQKTINPIIDIIKNNKNNNTNKLKSTLLSYFYTIKNCTINEIQKCGLFLDKTKSLVPIDFWKQNQIDYKLFEKK